MKKCSHCGTGKAGFYRNKSKTDGMSDECRECVKKRIRVAYAEDTERVKARKKKTQKERIALNKESVLEYLLRHPCTDCGEKDPIVLEFDHVTGTKVAAVNLMVIRGHSLTRVNAEISKCVVRCANCHRRKTAVERGYFRAL